MILYYNTHKNDIYQPEINDDIWLNILLQSDVDTLKTSCQLNKITSKICGKNDFWKIKFEQDGLFFCEQSKIIRKIDCRIYKK